MKISLLESLNSLESSDPPYVIYCNSPLLNPDKERNTISTSKYNWFNFFPKMLMEQFSRIANIYFLIIAILQSTKAISYSEGTPVILLPLVIIIIINGIKDFYEDYKRKSSDNEENSRKCQIYNLESKEFLDKTWGDIVLGDIIKVFNGEIIPADCIMLNCSEESGICYVETKNIDGETSLKHKKINTVIKDECSNERDLSLFRYLCVTKQPNEYIYQFDATLYKATTEGVVVNQSDYHLIDKNSFLLRGSSLQQTEFIYATVVYVGHKTKSMINSPNARAKSSSVEKIMGYQIVAIFIFQIILSFFSSCFSIGIYSSKFEEMKGYLVESEMDNLGTMLFMKTGTWILIFTNFVPISLLVTMELTKFIQAIFIIWDYQMVDKSRNKGVSVQASTLNEELGQVKYIFSDKTGTLTKNYMQFETASIGNEVYGSYLSKKNDNQNENKGRLEDEYGTITNVNFIDSNDKLKNVLQEQLFQDKKDIDQFFLCLCLCNTVITDSKKFALNNTLSYQASSPDEKSLISFARSQKYIFLNRSVENVIQIKKRGVISSYRVLHILEYSSERKKMSVIVECPDKRIRLYSKGADSVMTTMLALNPEQISITEKHLTDFAIHGLRTLMVAYKKIPNEEYIKWNEKYKQIAYDINKKELELPKLYDLMEKDLKLLGATGIKDQLADEVEDTIDAFMKIGVKVWMLTGDKLDTAKNIAYSCKLFNSETVLFEIKEKSNLEEIQQTFGKALRQISQSKKTFGILISSDELAIVFGDLPTQDLFNKICLMSNSVVCSRVSPKQKAEVVSMVKIAQDAIVLAVGDGSNDVGMITEANIGIGIFGVEGTQAARASDYSIAQFSHLRRLLFFHGREAYRRNTYVICYNFYKNVLFVLPMFFLGTSNAFSGQTLYDPWIHQMFNTFFAVLPIIYYGIYDIDKSPEILTKNGKYYLQGVYKKLFHYKRFWKWVFQGALEGLIIFFICQGAFYSMSSNGKDQDFWSIGTSVYASIVIGVNLNIIIYTNTHTIVSLIILFLSAFLYFAFVLYMSTGPSFKILGNTQMVLGDLRLYLVLFEANGIIVIGNVFVNKIVIFFGLIVHPDTLPPYKELILGQLPGKIIEQEMESGKHNDSMNTDCLDANKIHLIKNCY